MHELVRDVRQAARGLLKSPTYSLVAVLTLALGIGATSAIYTVVKSVLLAPLPYPEPERLVLIQEKNPEAGFPRFGLSPLNFRDYRAMSESFEAMAARTRASLALGGDDGPARRLAAWTVTSDFLRVFGVPPVLGRDFDADDDRPGAPRTVILSHALWQDLGGDPGIVDAELRIDGEPRIVIGVLPPDVFPDVDLLAPLAHDYESSSRGAHWLTGFGRLKDGVTLEQARSELEAVAAALVEQYPDSNTGWSAIVDPLHERVIEDVRVALWVLFAAVGLVLLVACANVANLTLARLLARGRELALRSALGAGRGRLLRQLLTESVLLATIAGALGLFLATRATAWLVKLAGDDVPRAEDVAVDGGVLVFTLVLTLGTALLFGLLPALRISRTDLATVLKEGGQGRSSDRRGHLLRPALVTLEVALALVVLVGAGLLLESFTRLLAVEPGMKLDPVWTAGLSLPERYGENEAHRDFLRRLVEEAETIPGVARAAVAFPMPLGGQWINAVYLEGEPLPDPNRERNVGVTFVSPGFFDVLGIPLRRGRPFVMTDDVGAERVVVIGASAAAAFWPDQDPIGKRMVFGRPEPDEEVEWMTVVGVAGDVRHGGLDAALKPVCYVPILQSGPPFTNVLLRAAGSEPAVLAGPLRELVGRLDPDLALGDEASGRELLRGAVAKPRFNATLLGLFAGLGLLLAAIGVFGVVSYAVGQRLRELGVRVALGARRRQIVALVLAGGLRPVLLGVALGLAAAFAASRLLESLVFGVGTADPGTYAVTTALLVAVAVLASLLPALRATRVDPVDVLRAE